MFLGRQISVGGEEKFLSEFHKSGSPSSMWQSLATIGQATSEIGGEKRTIETTSYQGNSSTAAFPLTVID